MTASPSSQQSGAADIYPVSTFIAASMDFAHVSKRPPCVRVEVFDPITFEKPAQFALCGGASVVIVLL